MTPTRRTFLKSTVLAFPASSMIARASVGEPTTSPAVHRESIPSKVDVLIYGATPAGIAAAVAARRDNASVLLVDENRWVGGLVTNGLTHTDFRTFEGITGFFLEFSRAVQAHYAATYGPDSQQVKDSFGGTQFEPKVARLVFEKFLADHQVPVALQWRLFRVRSESSKNGPKQLTQVDFLRGGSLVTGELVTVQAAQFIDATYEGDLLAMAGDAFEVGREGRGAFGESLAPEQADRQLQAYNFRLTMTNDPANRVMPSQPAGYHRLDYMPVLPLLESGAIKSVYCSNSGGMYKTQVPRLPNQKADINDVSQAPVRLSMPGENDAWPTGSADDRRAIFRKHLAYNLGLLWFLQNDPAVPIKFRNEAREWGWCRDEYPDNGHLPEQLYVREARRLQGQYIFTQNDVDPSTPDELRAPVAANSIAMGDYGPNCHGTGHVGPKYGGKHVGEFYHRAPPYGIPQGVIESKNVSNLLVVGAVSSSHVGFCALRLEPIWTSLGQAAGHLAAMRAVGADKLPPTAVLQVLRLQRRLWQLGAATAYVSDVLPGHADFAAVQWWATIGGLHGEGANGIKPGTRGKNISGQYYEAFPGHAAELDKPLDDKRRQQWVDLVAKLLLPTDPLPKQGTRGEFIRSAYGVLIGEVDAARWDGRLPHPKHSAGS